MTNETNPIEYPAVMVAKGRYAGQVGQVICTYGKQSVVIRGMGTVYRRSLTLTSRRALLAAEAGVTYAWLREDLTEAEADAWLGIS